jgi:hypothetical protein
MRSNNDEEAGNQLTWQASEYLRAWEWRVDEESDDSVQVKYTPSGYIHNGTGHGLTHRSLSHPPDCAIALVRGEGGNHVPKQDRLA